MAGKMHAMAGTLFASGKGRCIATLGTADAIFESKPVSNPFENLRAATVSCTTRCMAGCWCSYDAWYGYQAIYLASIVISMHMPGFAS